MFVYVYRNLKHGRKAPPLYSIMRKGKVIARRHQVLLTQATFVVREAGRRRVIQTGRKNVHAFVKGYLTDASGAFGIDASGPDLPVKIKYDPCVAAYFFVKPDRADVAIGRRVYFARGVLLNANGISACYIGG